MLIKVDLSSFISNSTRYALIGIDLEKCKTVEDVVTYLVKLFNIQINGNVLLFAGKWFIHGSQSSNILQEFETEFRLEVEDELSKVEIVEQLQTDNKCDLNGVTDLVSEKTKTSRRKYKIDVQLQDSTPDCGKDNIKDADAHSTSKSSHPKNVHKDKKRKRHTTTIVCSEDEFTENSELVKSSISNKKFKPCVDIELTPASVLNNTEQIPNCDGSSFIESMDFTNFNLPLKKKRIRKHNKVKKREKSLAREEFEYEECSKTKSKNRNKHASQTEWYLGSKLETETAQLKLHKETVCEENKYISHDNPNKEHHHSKLNHLAKHSTPIVYPKSKKLTNGNCLYKTDSPLPKMSATEKYYPELKTEISDTIHNTVMIRGPPKYFQPIPEINETCEAMFTELRMLESSCYPIIFDPKPSSMHYSADSKIFNKPKRTPIATNDDRPIKEVVKCDKIDEGIQNDNEINRPTETKSPNLNLRCNGSDKSHNSSNKFVKKYRKRIKAPPNSTSSILNMLRNRENGTPSEEDGSIADSDDCLNGKTDTPSEPECNQSKEVMDETTLVRSIGPRQPCIAGDVDNVDNTIDETLTRSSTISDIDKDIKSNSSTCRGINGTFSEIESATLNSESNMSTVETEKLSVSHTVLEDSSKKSVIKMGIKMELYPIIHTIPMAGDIVGFKTMNFDQSFRPVYSEYQIGKVISAAGPILSFNFAGYDDANALVIDYTEETTEVDSREMHDARLIFP